LEDSFRTTLEAARVGAEWAWTAIYRDLAPGVLRYLRARGAAEPEDLLGTVFLEVVRALPRFEGGHADFRAWVLAIAHRRLIDELRCRRRRPLEPAADETLQASSPSGDAEDDAVRSMEADRIRGILERLSADQRDVLLLRILLGLSIEETARVLHKTPGAVKSLQARGLARLRRQISRQAVSFQTSPTITETR
jgi:RNA polymerase sigma-70 factor (ECF subfamily)